MHIVVCINHIPDPEAPAKHFELDEQSRGLGHGQVNRVIGPFDENALETGLQLRDAVGGTLTAITLGPATNEDALRRALAVRYDAAVHIREDRAADLDSFGVALVLGAAIRKLASVGLVLCGRQGGDWDSSQVGQLLAEELGFSCVALVQQIQLAGDSAAKMRKEIPGGTALVEAALPAVATVTNTWTNQLRVAKVKDLMMARRAAITTWGAADLGFDMDELVKTSARVRVRKLFTVDAGTKAEMIDGDSLELKAEQLAKRILGMKIL